MRSVAFVEKWSGLNNDASAARALLRFAVPVEKDGTAKSNQQDNSHSPTILLIESMGTDSLADRVGTTRRVTPSVIVVREPNTTQGLSLTTAIASELDKLQPVIAVEDLDGVRGRRNSEIRAHQRSHSRASSLEVPQDHFRSQQSSDDSEALEEDAPESSESAGGSELEGIFDDSSEDDEDPTKPCVDFDRDLKCLGDHVTDPTSENPRVTVEQPEEDIKNEAAAEQIVRNITSFATFGWNLTLSTGTHSRCDKTTPRGRCDAGLCKRGS